MSMLSRKFSFAAAVTVACALPISPAFAAGEKIVAAFHNLAEPFDVFMLGQ
jgi:hypothetical protein